MLLLLEELRGARAATRLSALAERLHVSERQLRRDAGALVEAGHELAWEKVDGRAAVKLARPGREAIVPSQRERFSLLAVQRVFSVLEGTPFGDDVQSILGRLFRANDASELEAWGRRITYIAAGGIKPYGADREEILDELLTALIHQNRVDVRYRPANGRAKEGVLEPHGLAIYRHGLYFVGAFVGGTHANYVLPLERFTSAARRRKERFELPPGFDVATVFENALGVVLGGDPVDVVLELDAKVAHLLDVRRFHRSQRTVTQPDGSVRLTMHVATTPDLISSILAWGEHCRVVEPEELRERIESTLEAALANARELRSRRADRH
ncbi:MAG: WYL domain-containing protein [Sandaracinus sp.]